MSKRQKGRKHRTVNRTPRPRGAGRRTRGAMPGQTSSAPPPRAQAPEPAAKASTAKAAATEAGTGTSGGAGAGGDAPVFSGPARDGGLGRNAARTWERLEGSADGTTVDELCASVGYTAPTIRKHLSGLAEHGMAEERDGRWYAAQDGPDARSKRSEREPEHASR
ncbi:helix-turn-helix domain-containing protein [Streptomyces daliensis]